MTGSPRHFASDNNAGICPEVFAALAEANQAHAAGYGDDAWTHRAQELFRETFETDCEVFFVFNGTASNCLALWSLCDPFHGIVCHEHSHIHTDECGAPGFFLHGATLLPAGGPLAKLTPDAVRAACAIRHGIHAPEPRALSLTQTTELGAVYSQDELGALGAVARELGLFVHLDGARFANAVASLGASPADLTHRVGVDVLSLGGTKDGAAFGEAVVFFNKDRAANFQRRAKQSGQLASKMRFLSAQWVGLLEGGAWLRHAAHANGVAAYLVERLEGMPGVSLAYPRQANAVFSHIPITAADALTARGWRFYNDVGPDNAARLMCSWDSTEADVDAFTADLRAALQTR